MIRILTNLAPRGDSTCSSVFKSILISLCCLTDLLRRGPAYGTGCPGQSMLICLIRPVWFTCQTSRSSSRSKLAVARAVKARVEAPVNW